MHHRKLAQIACTVSIFAGIHANRDAIARHEPSVRVTAEKNRARVQYTRPIKCVERGATFAPPNRDQDLRLSKYSS